MKLLEKFIYSGIIFLVIYVVLSVGLRVFNVTTDYASHIIGGVSATIIGVLVFMYFLIKK